MGGPGFDRWRIAALAVSVCICLGMVAAVAYGAAEEPEAGVKVMPDSSTIIQVINFVLLIFILNSLLYKPIRRILLQRKEKFDSLKVAIDTFQNDAREKDAAFDSGIKEARRQGVEKRNVLVQEAEAEEKRIVENITRQAQEELGRVREKIVRDTENVRTALQTQIEQFAKDISQKILGRTI
jgi:F-type H+-transporting ATPase subunit b